MASVGPERGDRDQRDADQIVIAADVVGMQAAAAAGFAVVAIVVVVAAERFADRISLELIEGRLRHAIQLRYRCVRRFHRIQAEVAQRDNGIVGTSRAVGMRFSTFSEFAESSATILDPCQRVGGLLLRRADVMTVARRRPVPGRRIPDDAIECLVQCNFGR
jgi:hypothetical protein